MNKSDNIDLLSKALVQAQAEMPSVTMDAVNPFFKSKYATLGAIIQATRPVLAKYGLAVSQFPVSDSESGMIGVETMLIHESGQWLSAPMAVKVEDKNPSQAAGSAITYIRRYSLAAVLGIYSDEDDDGNASQKKPAPVATAPLTIDDAADMKGTDNKRYGDCAAEELQGKIIGITKKYGNAPTDPNAARKLQAAKMLLERMK